MQYVLLNVNRDVIAATIMFVLFKQDDDIYFVINWFLGVYVVLIYARRHQIANIVLLYKSVN